MLTSLYRFCFTCLILILVGCSPEDTGGSDNPNNPTENPGSSENPDVNDDLIEITGTIALGENLQAGNLKVVGLGGEYEVAENGNYTAGITEQDKRVLFVGNTSGDVLYAAFVKSENQDINATTTAEVMFGMMPWTASTNFNDLSNILSELEGISEFKALAEAIEQSVSNNESPLTDGTVLLKFDQLLASSESQEAAIMRIPEVSYDVEPQVDYNGSSLIIKNDGTTTAAWGVEVLDYLDNSSLTGNLILPGNEVSFPSFTGVFKYFYLNEGTATDVVFKSGESLDVPLGVESKYKIEFGSPTRLGLLNSSLSWEAVAFNIYVSFEDILAAFGFDMELSKIYDQGCANNIFDGTVNLMVNAVKEDEFNKEFFIKESYDFLKSSVAAISECSEIFDNMNGVSPSKKELFLRKALQFLNVYSKLETSFVLGKRIGDMRKLHDITICRQVLDEEVYPCFKLVENPDIDNTVLAKDERFQLTVGTQLDITPEVQAYPEGVKIHWEVLEGDGALQSEATYVGADGIAEVWFTAGEEEKQVVHASVQGQDGNVIEEVEYELEVTKFDYQGSWRLDSYNENGTLDESYRIEFDNQGNAISNEYVIWGNDSIWRDYGNTPWQMIYYSSENLLTIIDSYGATLTFEVESIDSTTFKGTGVHSHRVLTRD